MADPYVTNSFTDGAGNYIYASEVNQNFTDLIGAINSGSSADLGCETFKINSVPFASAVVSSVAGVDIAPANVTATSNLYAANASVTSSISCASLTVGTDQFYYSTGDFSCNVSGITDGAGNSKTFTARYTRIGDTVTLMIPSHVGSTDQTFTGSYDPVLFYVLEGFPDEITPSSALILDMPEHPMDNGSVIGASSIYGGFGISLATGSALSTLDISKNAQYWQPSGSGTKGYNKSIQVVYKLT
jgi:hypothetical protein